jgi:dipeptidyl aminopeptidase/acylaminoacyl peptidase
VKAADVHHPAQMATDQHYQFREQRNMFALFSFHYYYVRTMLKEIPISLTQFFEESEDGKILESLYLPSPHNNKKRSLVVLIHGFNKFGAWEHIFQARRLNDNGYDVLLPSQYGFGKSSPPRDYCGSRTVTDIAQMIECVSERIGVTKDRIVIRGASRGAIVAAMLATKRPKIAAAIILEAGAYDMRKDYFWEKKDPTIKSNIEKESGATHAALSERSAMDYIDAIETPLLIIHGSADETISVEQAEEFARELNNKGKQNELIILEKKGHHLGGPSYEKKYILPFLEKHLK